MCGIIFSHHLAAHIRGHSLQYACLGKVEAEVFQEGAHWEVSEAGGFVGLFVVKSSNEFERHVNLHLPL